MSKKKKLTKEEYIKQLKDEYEKRREEDRREREEMKKNSYRNGIYKGYEYTLDSYLWNMWKGDTEHYSALLILKDIPCGEYVRLFIEKDYKGKQADKTKWCKGYVHLQKNENGTHWVIIPFNELLITLEEIIDIVDEIIQELSR